MVAHHSNWRSAFDIIGGLEDPADPRANTEGSEEIPRHELSVPCFRLLLAPHPPDAQSLVTALQGRQIGKLWGVVTEVFVKVVGEDRELLVLCVTAPSAAMNLISDPPQLIGLGHGQRLQHDLLHE